MSIRGVEAPVQRFKKLKKLGAVAIVAALIAAVIVGTLIFLGLMDSLPLVPKKRISFLGFGISPQWTVYLSTFALVATIILVYVSYGRAIRRLVLKARKSWSRLPRWAKGVILGLEAGVVAGLSVYLVGISVYSYPWYLPVLVGGAGWLLVGLLTLFLLGKDWDLAEWAKALNTGVLIAAVIAVVFTFMFANVLPGYGTNVVFLLGWALLSYGLARRIYGMEDSFVMKLLVRSGYAQVRQMKKLPVSVATGFGIGLVVAVVAGLFGSAPSNGLFRAALSLFVVWPMVLVAVYWGWPSYERTNLVIEEIKPRDDGDRELTVRNVGDDMIDLSRAKLGDAERTIYGTKTTVSLGAGQARKIRIAPEFTLDSSGTYQVTDLPFGFSLERTATHPSVITRDGKRFTLLWADEVPDSRGSRDREESQHTESANPIA